jgi:membrane protease YdiL (CAAX protease family)
VTAVARPRLALLAGVAGCLLLVARPTLPTVGSDAKVTLALVFAGLLVVGWAWPAPASGGQGRLGLAVAAGSVAFAAGRILGGGQPPARLTLPIIALGTLAAVAEEALFRRLVYGALLPSGPAVAVVGSAMLFAIVHVTVYGLWVLPLDLAAGLVFGWQRWATGSWRAPAITHIVANLLVVL